MPPKTPPAKKKQQPPLRPKAVAPARIEPPPPKPATIEERTATLEARLQKAEPGFQASYRENLDMSWIYHDSALEGVVYTFQELKTAIDPMSTVVADSSLQPVCEEIRRHREALDYIRDYATKRRLPINLDVVKKIYVILHPEEGDVKTVRYRKDVPQHRLYFHEYAAPDKIAVKMRQILDWIADPETKSSRNSVRIAARAHYDMVRVFPFTHDSGKVARLFMNLMLLRNGYPPAIVHSTERQRYYEALKGSSAAMTQIVQEAIDNNLASIEKLLDTNDHKPVAAAAGAGAASGGKEKRGA
jgi:Fic family protein